MSPSRRTFLHRVSMAAALGVLSQVPGRRLWALTPYGPAPELDETLFRELALQAVEAARAAGATFGDVRVGMGQRLGIRCLFNRRRQSIPQMLPPILALQGAYGIRAIVDGAWGFAAGNNCTREGIVRTAQSAVARARANRPRRPRTLELAPAPRVVNGRWAVPVAEDPFAIPVREQVDRQVEGLAAVAAIREVQEASVNFSWQRALRVFASSDGTLLVQRTAFAIPGAEVTAQAGDGSSPETESVEGLEAGPYGYEAVSRVDLTAALREAAQRAIAAAKLARVPPVPVEVGRYDLVFGADAMAGLLTNTLAEVLDAERALGYQANRAGTSFAAPPAELLGHYQVGSKLLTLRADRTRVHGAATVAWDDEGVPTEAFTLVENGVIVDYLTDRQCAPELTAWYRARGEAVRSHGCASGVGQQRPSVRLPNLTLEPQQEAVTVDDLIAATKRGFYLESIWGGADQQVLNNQFAASWRAREIRNGKLGGRVRHLGFQFITPEFWKSLEALGGAATVRTTLRETGLPIIDPLQVAYASVRAVPGHFRQVNVLNIGRTA